LQRYNPAPEEWNHCYWYSLVVLFFRVLFETNVFCMDVDNSTSRWGSARWNQVDP
jgi:hypothetical protein